VLNSLQISAEGKTPVDHPTLVENKLPSNWIQIFIKMAQQPDPQMAMQMAQQEMEYRVELFNK